MPSTQRSIALSLSPTRNPARTAARRLPRGFTITELLVAIGIIVLLIGILLPALAKALANAKRSQTSSTMQEFAKAIEAFQQEFGYYPGLVPEEILATDPRISSTENAILHLMGGAIGQDDPEFATTTGSDWSLVTIGSGAQTFSFKFNRFDIGKGPRVSGKQFPPFFSPKEAEFSPIVGQVGGADGSGTPLVDIPDVLDAWGQPILYFRSSREIGPLVGATGAGRFNIVSNAPYLRSHGLADLGKSQEVSLLNPESGVSPSVEATLAQFIRNPGFGASDKPLDGTPRGKFALISAGPDGIFLSKFDGLGNTSTPIVNVVGTAAGQNKGGPASMDLWDDVRVFGGG